MKLHLPKMLRVAVLTAMTFTLAAPAVAGDTIQLKTNSYSAVSKTGDFTVGDGDYIGYKDTSGTLYKSFTGSQRTQNLTITGNLTIEENGEVAVGGITGTTYTKLTVTGSITVDGGFLAATVTNIGSLTLNSGSVVLRDGDGGADGNLRYGQGNSALNGSKMATINGLTSVASGTLYAGYAGIGYANKGPESYHCLTGFGGGIEQSGGTVAVRNDTLIGTGISQIGYEDPNKTDAVAKMYVTDNLTLNTTSFTIEQSNTNEESKMILGRLACAYESNNNYDVNIDQSGAGTIHLAGGAYFRATSSVDITQSGTGKIQVGAGNSESVFYDEAGHAKGTDTGRVGGYYTRNAAYTLTQNSTSSLTVLAKAQLPLSSATIGGTVTIAKDGTLGVSSNSLEQTSSGIIFIEDNKVDNEKGHLDFQSGSSFGVCFTQEAQKTMLADKDIAETDTQDFKFSLLAATGSEVNELAGLTVTAIGMNPSVGSAIWSVKDAKWDITDGKAIVSGTLTYNPWITISAARSYDVLSDPNSYLKLGVKINKGLILGGNNSYSLGTAITGASVTLASVNALGTGAVTTSGTCTLKQDSAISSYNINLGGTIQNSGTLTLEKGVRFAVSAESLHKDELAEAYFDLNGDISATKDGFYRAVSYKYYIVKNEGTGASLSANSAKILLGSTTYTLDATGVIDCTTQQPSYKTYYMTAQGPERKVSDIQNASNNSTSLVEMTGGDLTVDKSIKVASSGGNIAVGANQAVSGTIENAKVSGTTGTEASGIVEATLSGENTLTGKLIVGGADVLSSATVTTTGETSLSTAKDVTAKLTQAITNEGMLTLSGSYDVSGLKPVKELTPNFIDVNGKEGTTGFAQYDRFSVQMINNVGEASLELGDSNIEYTPKAKATVGTLEGELDKEGVATFVGGTDYSTYVIDNLNHQVSVSQIQAASNDQTSKVEMSDGKLTADESIEVETTGGTLITEGDDTVVSGTIENTIVSAQGGEISASIKGGELTTTDDALVSGTVTDTAITAEGGKIAGDINGGTLTTTGDALVSGTVTDTAITAEGGEISGTIGGTSSLTAMSGITTLSGSNNSYNGGTVVKDGAKLVVKENGGLGTGGVTVESGATLDMKTDGDAQIEGGLTVNDNGTITLNNGSLLVVDGSVTLNDGAIIILKGEYDLNSALVSSTTGALTMGDVTLVYNGTTVELEMQNGQIVLVSKFKQNKADATTLSNWGIATASRAVVNAVRGQRSNTGCIANGKGTAWVASLGSKHEINGSDIDISGAAVGADVKVGRNSRIGIALGYAEGEVQPAGFSQVDQEGSYLVVYGEHGLKKLSATSCLSMDWVAAYGTTDSEVGGLKWEQDSLQLNSRVNWNKKVGKRTTMSVFGGVEYFANNSDTVDGVKTGSIQNLRGEIGVGARYVAWGIPAVTDGKSGLVLAKGCEKLVLNGEVRYMNDMVRSNPVVRMNGLSGMGDNPGRQGIGIEAGATYRIGERWSASANYGFNTMEDSKEHRLNIGAAYTF